MQAFFDRWINFIYSLVADWPPIGKWDGLNLVVGVLGLLPAVFQIVQSWKEGLNSHRLAAERLTYLIVQRINTPALLTETSIRGLARNLEVEIQCPHFTDEAIAKSIRSAAIQLEQKHKGAPLTQKLGNLNPLLRAFDKEGPLLLSIASKDRMWAYLLSTLSFSITVVGLQFWTTRLEIVGSVKSGIIFLLSLLQLFLIIISFRASKFWKESTGKLNSFENPDQIGFRKKSHTPAFYDIFFRNAITDSITVHTKWAPIWEEMLFRLIPELFLLVFIAWAIVQIGHAISVDNAVLKVAVAIAVVVLIPVIFYFSTWVFSKWHSYEYLRSNKLRKQLDFLLRDIKLAELGHIKITEDKIRNALMVSRELWTISGWKGYKAIEQEIYDASISLFGRLIE